jgi:hypothetical protein
MCDFLDKPNYSVPENDVPEETRRKWLLELCVKYVHEYLISFEVEPIVKQLQILDEAMGAKFAQICKCNLQKWLCNSIGIGTSKPLYIYYSIYIN